jgi:hypothetical protein
MDALYMYKLLPILAIIAILLVACTQEVPLATMVITKNSSTSTPGGDLPGPTPQPDQNKPVHSVSPFPPAATPGGVSNPFPVSGYEPQSGDKMLLRDQAFVNMEYTSVVIRDGVPVEVEVSLSGHLSDPCHQLRVLTWGPDESQSINLEVYSVVDPSMACITVVAPFEVMIPLGTLPVGHYNIQVNEVYLGEFDI